MSLNVGQEVTALGRMTVKQLRQKYAEVFDEDTNGNHKAWLVKRTAWRIQTRAEGGLSERVRQHAVELADDADLRLIRCVPCSSAMPIVGRVAAGRPILAEENIVGEVLVESAVVGSEQCLALRVTGQSMVDAGIADKDLVIVRRQPIAENGYIVVALLGE